jgi:predicted phosphodiesterase
MRLGLIADIHANAPALAAVLAALDAEGVRDVVALGDLVGYNAMPHETLQMVRDRGIASVAGNHDLMAIGRLDAGGCGPIAQQAMAWTRRTLTPEEVAQLALLPDVLRPGPRMLCVHATLGDPTRRLRIPSDLMSEAERLGEAEPGIALCLMGHEHQACVHAIGHTVVTTTREGEEIALPRHGFAFVNPGTVGYPRDGDPRASYAVFDSQRWAVTLRRIEYDQRPVEEANAQAGLWIAAGGAPWAPDDDEGFLARIRGAIRRISGKVARRDA